MLDERPIISKYDDSGDTNGNKEGTIREVPNEEILWRPAMCRSCIRVGTFGCVGVSVFRCRSCEVDVEI